ncbi:MAG: serine/threonine protein kinase [Candidatus Sericytochromatia bacterium]
MAAPTEPAFPEIPGYAIRRLLGAGGFGHSYLAEHAASQSLRVIKQLSFAHLQNWKSLELFEREARVLAQLQHPQIPAFADYLVEGEPPDQSVFLIQAYVPGQSLQQRVEQGQRLDEAQAVQLAREICEVLVYLQDLSPPLMHRDIKPSHLILRPDAPASLIDFGAVRDSLRLAHDAGTTVVGTLGYMAPEQYQGDVSCASDIYALGASLLYGLLHRAPQDFKRQGLKLVFRPYLNVSRACADVLEHMLEPDPRQRYPHARALHADLLALQAGEAPLLGRPAGPRPEADLNPQSPSTPPARSPQLLLLVALAIIGLLVLLLVFTFSINQHERESYDAVKQRLEQVYEETYRAEFGPPPGGTPPSGADSP